MKASFIFLYSVYYPVILYSNVILVIPVIIVIPVIHVLHIPHESYLEKKPFNGLPLIAFLTHTVQIKRNKMERILFKTLSS